MQTFNLKKSYKQSVLACGSDLKGSFCLTKGGKAFLSGSFGGLSVIENFTEYEKAIRQCQKVLGVQPDIVAYDLHPEYHSSKFALSLGGIAKNIGIQHHHAHILACMAENGIGGEVIGAAFDGLGFGTDGSIWGGEFLIARPDSFERAAHFKYAAMPGGEMAVKEPWRMAIAYLYEVYGKKLFDLNMGLLQRIGKGKAEKIVQMIEKGINSPLTSSAGRLFDGVSALAGVKDIAVYEGEAAIELEKAAAENVKESYGFDVSKKDGELIISWDDIIKGVVKDLISKTPASIISSKFHNAMADLIVNTCAVLREETGLKRAALSGGVFQNRYLLKRSVTGLKKRGFEVFTHNKVPPTDAALPLGQAIAALSQ